VEDELGRARLDLGFPNYSDVAAPDRSSVRDSLEQFCSQFPNKRSTRIKKILRLRWWYGYTMTMTYLAIMLFGGQLSSAMVVFLACVVTISLELYVCCSIPVLGVVLCYAVLGLL
jgi:hypothetical protein